MLDINAAKISNLVTFDVDKNSLKEAKNAIKDIQKFAENIQPSLNMTKIRRQMKELEMMAKKTHRSMPTPTSAPSGGGKPSSGGSGSGGTNKPPKKTDEQKRADRLAKRSDVGDLRMDAFNERARHFTKADISTQRQARAIIEQTVALYKDEKITLQRLNQNLAHQLDSLRRSHREKQADIEDEVRGRRRVRRELEAEAKTRRRMRERDLRDIERNHRRELAQQKRDRNRRYDQMKEGAMGLNPRMVMSSMLGAGLFAGGSVVGNTLMQANERIKMVAGGAKNVEANPNSILTMTAWGEQNGVDSANIIKAIDNLKDVRERMGDTMMATEWNAKEKKWKGGDIGINDIMNEFGWNPDQIKHLQNDPLAFVQATVNEGQRRGMNSAQLGRLMENLGDDLMHYQRMFLNNGAEYDKTLKMLQRTGAALTKDQIAASEQFTKFSATVAMVGQGMSNYFLEGFVSALPKDDSWLDNVKTLDAFAKGLGEEFGKATVDVANFAGELTSGFNSFDTWLKDTFPDTFGKNSDPNKSMPDKLNDASQVIPNTIADWLFNATGMDTRDVGRAFRGEETRSTLFGFGNPLEELRQTAYAPNVPLARNAPIVQNTIAVPSDLINLTVSPSAEFGNIIDARLQSNNSSFLQTFTLSSLSGQSNSGG